MNDKMPPAKVKQRNPVDSVPGDPASAGDPAPSSSAGICTRQWIRVTRTCNNNCIFCLDKECQDGSVVPVDQLTVEMGRGIGRGAVRAILSGGEPTLHPNLIDLIRAGRRLGYREVQVITNGRMFAYPQYLSDAIEAGLTEITFSIHGHTPHLHDWHTRTKGSFAQALKGLVNALRSGRILVSVDIVLTRRNHAVLPEMVSRFHRMGAREFDLLAPVPFGAAWEHKHRVFFDFRGLAEPLGRTLEIAEQRGIRIWTNRLPAPFLEGREHLIQDPHKFLDEIRGREDEFRGFIHGGRPMPCAGERCPHCFMKPFCRELSELLSRLQDRNLTDVYAARPAAHRVSLLVKAGARRLVIDSDSPISSAAVSSHGVEIIRRIRRPDEWEQNGAKPHVAREVVLTPALKRAVLSHPDRFFDVPNVRFSMDLSEPDAADGRPGSTRQFWDALGKRGYRPSRTAAIPRCITRSTSPPESTPWDAAILLPDGRVDLGPFSRHFIDERYRAKSLRCQDCPSNTVCDGLPVRHLKRCGFSELGWATTAETA